MRFRIFRPGTVLICLALAAAVASFTVVPGEEPGANSGDVDMRLPTTARTRVSNGRITIHFKFKGRLVLGKRRPAWTPSRVAPYRKAAQRWLKVIRGARGLRKHTITIYVQVRPFHDGLGAASPNYEKLRRVGRHYFPREGEMLISSHAYSADFQREHERPDAEFQANILHEMGHIFGIGSLWNLSREDGRVFGEDQEPNLRHWARTSRRNGGAYYDRPKALAAYRSIFGKRRRFIPLLNGKAHLFSLEDDNKPRRLSDGTRIPEMEYELMANGLRLSVITVGLLDDLGWIVNYSAADPYRL